MWEPWYIAAFSTGLICVCLCILSFLFPNRKITLILRFSYDLLAICNGICIYFATQVPAILAITIVDAIGLVRDLVYLLREKYKWADHIFWLIFFEIIFACSIFLSWAGPISLLPVIGALFNNVGLYLKNLKKTRIYTLFGQTFFIVYNSLLINASDFLTILSLTCSVGFFLSALIGLIMLIVRDKKKKIQ